MSTYSVRVVLTKTVEAQSADDALDIVDYFAGSMNEHEIEVEKVEHQEAQP